MVIHQENTTIADRAMMGSEWLNVLTMAALFAPEGLQVANCFGPVTQQLFHFLGDTFKSIIFYILDFSVFSLYRFKTRPILPLLDIFSELFNLLKLLNINNLLLSQEDCQL